MRGLAIFFLLLTVAGCASAPRGTRAPSCAWRVCVSYTDNSGGREYTATNQEPVPVTILMTFRSFRNVRPPPGRRVEVVVPPQTTQQFARLPSVRRDRSVSATVTIAIDLGSSTNEAGDFVYAVPFGGSESRELIQGYGGTDSHMASMHYSLDFAMPRGTPVLAAREGTVLLVQDGFTEGGVDPALLERANLVVIAHRDGTMASYGHLSPGVRVERGDHVLEGALLGYSGATGFAGQPHLHFHVGNRMLGEPGRTIPVEMRDSHGRAIDLEVGARLEPAQRR